MKKLAIIGCGFIAKKHAKAIESIVDIELVAVCDKDAERMEYYINEYGVQAYTDIEDLLKNDSIDIVSICTPSSVHAPLAIKVAEAKKHMIVEKPIAMNIDDAQAIVEEAEKNNVKLSVVHPNRFRPVVIETKYILDNDLLGKISHVNCLVNWNRSQEYYDQAPWRGTREHDGGVLMNQAIHNLDLLLWFVGRPKEIFSMDGTRLRNIEAEDVSSGLVKFENGVIANIQAATTVYEKNYEESITIFGEKGTLKIGGTNALYFEYLEYEGSNQYEINNLKKIIEDDPFGVPGHQKVIKDMIYAIDNNTETAINGEEALKSLKLVNKMYESAKINQLVSW